MREEIIEVASQAPEFAQGIDVLAESLATTPITSQDLDDAIEMLEATLDNPAIYAETVVAAIADGLIDEGDAPAEFNIEFILSLLLALYGLQERLLAEGYARGGLADAANRLSRQGQSGDTMLAHINPREAEVLRRMGGQGTVNPNTGLAEYKSIKKLFKKVIPIAVSMFAPQLAPAIGSAIGLSGTAAKIVGGSLLGAGTAAIAGGDPLKGAVLGGIGSGLGSVAGSFVNKGLNLGLSAPVSATLGSGLVGGLAGAATGQGFGQGALQGVAGQLLKNVAGSDGMGSLAGTPNALQGAIQSGADTAGNMLISGYSPKDSLQGGVAAGIFSGGKSILSQPKPSEVVVEGVKDSSSNAPDTSELTGLEKIGDLIGKNKVPLALGALSLLGGAPVPEDVGTAIQELSPDQQEYFNRPSEPWDWDAIRAGANRANLSLTEFMAQGYNELTEGTFNVEPAGYYGGGMPRMTFLKEGGTSRYVDGEGTGRSDEIPAYLSDGEYVIDAETVAMLGDGSSNAGADALNDMRKNIRAHKGKALAKGKFSPNAKAPLTYLRQGMS